jgi:hypothetical protein
MPNHLLRIEHIHVDMHIYLVRKAIELREYGWRHIAEVIDAELLNEGLVKQALFKRIDKAHAAHHDMAVREWWIEARVQAQPL